MVYALSLLRDCLIIYIYKVGALDRASSSTAGILYEKGGCEATARKYLKDAPSEGVFLKIEMRIAFTGTPFLPWPDYVYPICTGLFTTFCLILWWVTNRICQQGDPFGPALSFLGIDLAAKSMESELNIWYLDDATIAGAPDTVVVELHALII